MRPTFSSNSRYILTGGGGGGGSGADLSAVEFISVDLTDGTWTLTDPDNLVDSVAHASGVNTVTMNALAAGSTNYVWSSSTTIRAPRWHKKLTVDNVSGAPQSIASGNTFSSQIIMEYNAPTSKFSTQMVAGVAYDATSTTTTTMNLAGNIIQYTSTGNPSGGAIGINTASVAAANANFYRVFGVCGFSAGRINTPTYINTTSAPAVLASGQRATNTSYADLTTNLDVVIGLGTLNGTATITAGQDAKIQAWYRVIRFDLPT